jgi:hypothetical protein
MWKMSIRFQHYFCQGFELQVCTISEKRTSARQYEHFTWLSGIHRQHHIAFRISALTFMASDLHFLLSCFVNCAAGPNARDGFD